MYGHKAVLITRDVQRSNANQLETFEEYLPRADSNLVATVTLVATGVQPWPSKSAEHHSQMSLLVPGNEVTLRYK